MTLSQAEREIRHKRIKDIYVWETVHLPPEFVQRCRERQIAIIFTR